jgi:signal transduction histidine kinase
MAFISDISARKRYEDELKRSEEQLLLYASELEKKVQSRTEALNQSVVSLENEVIERKKAEEEVRKLLEKERELNELKSKFVSIASHEFRTPLSTILSSASLVNQYKDRGDLDKITKHTQRIRSSVNHLTGILNDFLSLSKLEEGKLYVVREPVIMEDFFNEVAEDMIPTLKEGQHIDCTGSCTLTTLETDPRILRNILFNLISNASKYSESKPIHLSYECNSEEFTFHVRDEGMGIPDEDKKHIFTRFFRASNAGNVQGTGLGLNIVRRYVELLDGDIRFVSKYGKGSTFSVSLPLRP